MKLSESQLRLIIRQELQEMMTPEFGEDGGEKDKYEYGSKLGFKFDEESEAKSESIANSIIQAFEQLKQNPQLKLNVISLVRSEGHIELAKLIKTIA